MGATVVSVAPIGRRVRHARQRRAESGRRPRRLICAPEEWLTRAVRAGPRRAQAAAIFLRRGDVGAASRRLCLGAAR